MIQSQMLLAENANPPIGKRAWIITPTAAAKLAQTPVASGADHLIFDRNERTIAGVKTAITTAIGSGSQAIYGYIPDMALVFFGEPLLTVDRVTLAGNNQVQLWVHFGFNAAPLRPTIVASTDSAAQ
jgi:hypothetical protein